MKNIILCTVLVTMCLIFEAHANCNIMGQKLKAGDKYAEDCIEYTCHSDGTITLLECPEFRCLEGKQIGYNKMNKSKPYPECCPGPICKD